MERVERKCCWENTDYHSYCHYWSIFLFKWKQVELYNGSTNHCEN